MTSQEMQPYMETQKGKQDPGDTILELFKCIITFGAKEWLQY